MTQPDDIAARLPSPRDDEPRELRRDIVDELADHLHCAVARERLRDDGVSSGSNATNRDEAALSAALERFGDPAAVARRLWFDAMKEKIMSQRIVSITAVAACAACIACAFFMWRIVESNREAQAALLASQREGMQAMVAEIRDSLNPGLGGGGSVSHEALQALLKEANRPPAPSDNWWPLVVKLVDQDGKPAQGTVTYAANSTSAGQVSDKRRTNEDGVVDFGQLPSGQYNVRVTLETDLNRGEHVLLGPNRPREYTFVCPSDPVAKGPLRIELSPPENMRDERLYYVASVAFRERSVRGETWHRLPSGSEQPRLVLLDNQGKLLGEIVRPVTYGGSGNMVLSDGFPMSVSYNTSLVPISERFVGLYSATLHPYYAQAQMAPPGGTPLLKVLADPFDLRPDETVLITAFDVASDGSGVCRFDGDDPKDDRMARFWIALRQKLDAPHSRQGMPTAPTTVYSPAEAGQAETAPAAQPRAGEPPAPQ